MMMLDGYEWLLIELDTTIEGLVAASGTAPTLEEAAQEADHYAQQYSQDGRVRIEIYQVKRELCLMRSVG